MACASLTGSGQTASAHQPLPAGSNASSNGSGHLRQPLLPPPTGPAPPLPHYGPPPMQLGPPAYPQAVQPQYIGGDHSIYNPSAPPPSAAYGGFGGLVAVPQHSSGGDSVGGGSRLRLAGSGSGSESGVGGPAGGSVGGGGSSTVGSDGGFRARLLQQDHGKCIFLPAKPLVLLCIINSVNTCLYYFCIYILGLRSQAQAQPSYPMSYIGAQPS
jgi:hypothetical protein